jgi:CheY-like chemotaxis protein
MLEKNAGILLVEDDRVDVMTVQRALKKINISNPLHVARTAVEALAMLRGQADRAISPPPALILLDLNLPKMSGIEFLKELREDPRLKSLSVIVLTSSDEPRDRAAAFQYDVEDYIIKPQSFQEFTEAMATVLAYWPPRSLRLAGGRPANAFRGREA